MLYVVGTPIGNLEEITYRAVEALKQADIIACEDTRHSAILLNHYGIKKPLICYQKFNERKVCIKIVELLKDNKNVALISDAGMPLISDPGAILINMLIENDLSYTVISGPCACINALILSGMDTSSFCMAGFLPEKRIDCERFLGRFLSLESTLIFYAAPHDIDKILTLLYEFLGDRKVALVREISKVYEEVIRGKLNDLPQFVRKGEFVIVVEGATPKADELRKMDCIEHYQYYLSLGFDKKEAIKKTAYDRGVAKSLVYKELLTNNNGNGIIK